MTVLVSIATMNSRERLRDCLASLPRAAGKERIETMVIDNCSTDGTAEMIMGAFPQVGLVRNDRPLGFGANHNQVLRQAVAKRSGIDHVLVLNDDTVLYEESIPRLLAAANAMPRLGALAPRVIDEYGRPQTVAFRKSSPYAAIARAALGWPHARECPHDPEWLNGCCLLLPVDPLRHVGLFDERFFMYSEDVDLSLRLRGAGYCLKQCSDVEITHVGATTTSRAGLARLMQLQASRSFYLLLAKHYGESTARLVTTGMRLGWGARGVAKVVIGILTRDSASVEDGRACVRLSLYSPKQPVFASAERFD